MLAAKLGIRSAEFRRRNLIRAHEILGRRYNWRRASHHLRRGDFPAIFERALTEFGWDKQSEPWAAASRWAAAFCLSRASALGIFESARVEVDQGGHVRVVAGCTSQGQGTGDLTGASRGGGSNRSR